MQKFRWLFGGVILGFVAAHFINQNPTGKDFFDRVNRGAKEFNDAFSEGYKKGGSATASLNDIESALKSLKNK